MKLKRIISAALCAALATSMAACGAGRHFGIDTGTAERVGVRSRSADRGADAYDAHLYRMVQGWVEGSGELYQ